MNQKDRDIEEIRQTLQENPLLCLLMKEALAELRETGRLDNSIKACAAFKGVSVKEFKAEMKRQAEQIRAEREAEAVTA